MHKSRVFFLCFIFVIAFIPCKPAVVNSAMPEEDEGKESDKEDYQIESTIKEYGPFNLGKGEEKQLTVIARFRKIIRPKVAFDETLDNYEIRNNREVLYSEAIADHKTGFEFENSIEGVWVIPKSTGGSLLVISIGMVPSAPSPPTYRFFLFNEKSNFISIPFCGGFLSSEKVDDTNTLVFDTPVSAFAICLKIPFFLDEQSGILDRTATEDFKKNYYEVDVYLSPVRQDWVKEGIIEYGPCITLHSSLSDKTGEKVKINEDTKVEFLGASFVKGKQQDERLRYLNPEEIALYIAIDGKKGWIFYSWEEYKKLGICYAG